MYPQICVPKSFGNYEKANSDLFVHELECSDQVICLQNMYWSLYRWKNTATVQKLFADYTAMPPLTHGDNWTQSQD